MTAPRRDGKDYIVDVWVPVAVRVENVLDEEMAESIAIEWAQEQGVVTRFHEQVDASTEDFFFPSDSALKAEAGETLD